MSLRQYVIALAALALSATGFFATLATATATSIPVKVPSHPRPSGDVRISFLPRGQLPSGGYYYAVLVITKHSAQHLASASCAEESDMQDTAYGYPNPHRPLSLTLAPAKPAPAASKTPDWCAGAVYTGAVYAVPHAPPCRKSAPCYGTRPECHDGEPLCFGGRQAHGKLSIRREGTGKLPQPRDNSTRMIARFQIHFGGKHATRQ
jgi:hypothetical protein